MITKLKNLMQRTKNPHWKHLMNHYKCGICFKYMNGKCKHKQCKFKHPERCPNYTYSNGFKCEHIHDTHQPNGKMVKKNDNNKLKLKPEYIYPLKMVLRITKQCHLEYWL